MLNCSFNKLTDLPQFDNLIDLDCYDNMLYTIPFLPNIKTLKCMNNYIEYLPYFNTDEMDTFSIDSCSPIMNLLSLECYDHRYMHINDYENNKKITNKNINIYYKFRLTYYCLKYKKQLRDWLWLKIRKPKIEIRYSPNELKKLIENVDDYEELIDNWN
jgi:hypothetical protein